MMLHSAATRRVAPPRPSPSSSPSPTLADLDLEQLLGRGLGNHGGGDASMARAHDADMRLLHRLLLSEARPPLAHPHPQAQAQAQARAHAQGAWEWESRPLQIKSPALTQSRRRPQRDNGLSQPLSQQPEQQQQMQQQPNHRSGHGGDGAVGPGLEHWQHWQAAAPEQPLPAAAPAGLLSLGDIAVSEKQVAAECRLQGALPLPENASLPVQEWEMAVAMLLAQEQPAKEAGEASEVHAPRRAVLSRCGAFARACLDAPAFALADVKEGAAAAAEATAMGVLLLPSESGEWSGAKRAKKNGEPSGEGQKLYEDIHKHCSRLFVTGGATSPPSSTSGVSGIDMCQVPHRSDTGLDAYATTCGAALVVGGGTAPTSLAADTWPPVNEDLEMGGSLEWDSADMASILLGALCRPEPLAVGASTAWAQVAASAPAEVEGLLDDVVRSCQVLPSAHSVAASPPSAFLEEIVPSKMSRVPSCESSLTSHPALRPAAALPAVPPPLQRASPSGIGGALRCRSGMPMLSTSACSNSTSHHSAVVNNTPPSTRSTYLGVFPCDPGGAPPVVSMGAKNLAQSSIGATREEVDEWGVADVAQRDGSWAQLQDQPGSAPPARCRLPFERRVDEYLARQQGSCQSEEDAVLKALLQPLQQCHSGSSSPRQQERFLAPCQHGLANMDASRWTSPPNAQSTQNFQSIQSLAARQSRRPPVPAAMPAVADNPVVSPGKRSALQALHSMLGCPQASPRHGAGRQLRGSAIHARRGRGAATPLTLLGPLPIPVPLPLPLPLPRFRVNPGEAYTVAATILPSPRAPAAAPPGRRARALAAAISAAEARGSPALEENCGAKKTPKRRRGVEAEVELAASGSPHSPSPSPSPSSSAPASGPAAAVSPRPSLALTAPAAPAPAPAAAAAAAGSDSLGQGPKRCASSRGFWGCPPLPAKRQARGGGEGGGGGGGAGGGGGEGKSRGKAQELVNERLQALQRLVPNGNKADMASMLEEAAEYIKFMELQVKILFSCNKTNALAQRAASVSLSAAGVPLTSRLRERGLRLGPVRIVPSLKLEEIS
eukprot:jgi/Mesen1/5512/ME000279S04720